MHQIGLDEVARIQDGMRAGREGSRLHEVRRRSLPELKAFFEWMKARDDMYFKSREELLATYQAFGANVAPVLPKYFNLRPKTDYEVRLVEPFREASASSGSVPGPVARRQTRRHLLRERLRPEGAAALGAGVAVAARGGTGPSLPDLAAA